MGEVTGTGFTTFHDFTTTTNSTGSFTNSDGSNPQGGLVLLDSTLYGTAAGGGSSGGGTVFKLSTDGTGFTTLHDFTTVISNSFGVWTNTDGASPQSGLVLLGSTRYGTAAGGGSSGNGTVFALNIDGTGF